MIKIGDQWIRPEHVVAISEGVFGSSVLLSTGDWLQFADMGADAVKQALDG